MKKVIMVIAMLAAISSVTVNAAAANVTTYGSAYSVSPYYETASAAFSTLTISGTTAKCESKLIGHSDVTSWNVEQTLEQFWGLWIWNEVDGGYWNETLSISSGKVTNNISGLSSGKYRLKSVFTLTTSNGKTETFTVYSDEKSL